jgi:hypothetical protein
MTGQRSAKEKKCPGRQRRRDIDKLNVPGERVTSSCGFWLAWDSRQAAHRQHATAVRCIAAMHRAQGALGPWVLHAHEGTIIPQSVHARCTGPSRERLCSAQGADRRRGALRHDLRPRGEAQRRRRHRPSSFRTRLPAKTMHSSYAADHKISGIWILSAPVRSKSRAQCNLQK